MDESIAPATRLGEPFGTGPRTSEGRTPKNGDRGMEINVSLRPSKKKVSWKKRGWGGTPAKTRSLSEKQKRLKDGVSELMEKKRGSYPSWLDGDLSLVGVRGCRPADRIEDCGAGGRRSAAYVRRYMTECTFNESCGAKGVCFPTGQGRAGG